MSTRSAKPQPASALDGFLIRFLRCLDQFPEGFSPVADAARVAEVCDIEVAFVEALFVSARTRGLIAPFRSRGARGRYRWKVSHRGSSWLAHRDAGATTVPPSANRGVRERDAP